MLGDDRPILHRHRPAGEINHSPTMSGMPIMQRRFREGGGHRNTIATKKRRVTRESRENGSRRDAKDEKPTVCHFTQNRGRRQWEVQRKGSGGSGQESGVTGRESSGSL